LKELLPNELNDYPESGNKRAFWVEHLQGFQNLEVYKWNLNPSLYLKTIQNFLPFQKLSLSIRVLTKKQTYGAGSKK
jgi:hypothetical protein